MKINSKTWLRFLKEDGRKFSRALLALLIFTLALQILSIWNLELSGTDSPRVAGIAREMAVNQNYLIPRLNGKNFLEYPPLGYWPFAFALSMSEKPLDFLALLPLTFLGTGTVLITFLIGKKMAGERIGLIAGFILSTMSGFITLHRHCRVDPVLLFFITLSLYGFVVGYHASRERFTSFIVFYMAMAGAFLSKGIIGVAIPLGTAVVFLIMQKDLTAIRKLFLNPGVLFFLLPILLWGGSVWWLDGVSIFEEVIRQSLFRFFSPSADHAKPFYFYSTHGFVPLMPWTLVPLILLWYRLKPVHSREPLPHSFLLGFALIWFLLVFIGLSLSSAKRGLYLGPLYPSFALLTALGWDCIREKFPKIKRLEVYGLIILFLVIPLTYLLLVTPLDRKESLRPIFEIVSSQRTNGRIYLVDPSETLRGASFFYLGEKISVLSTWDLLSGRFEDRPGTTLVLNAYLDNSRHGSHIRTKGYRLIKKQMFGKDGVCVYSNGS